MRTILVAGGGYAGGGFSGVEGFGELLSLDRPGTATVMNARHAVRQGKLLADNIAATLRGREPKAYVHPSLGTSGTPVHPGECS